MPQLAQAIMSRQTAFAAGQARPMLDPRFGGMQATTGPVMNQWVSAAGYTQRPVFALVLETPKGFNYLDDSSYWHESVRAIMELHTVGIDGLDATMQVEWVDTSPTGRAGEFHQDFVNVKLNRSSISHRIPEKLGRPVDAILTGWVRMLMMDPQSGVAGIAMTGRATPDMLLPDFYTMTVIYIETDQLHKHVVKSFLCTNMAPRDAVGANTGRLEVGSANTQTEYNQGFTSITTVGAGVDAFAQRLLDDIVIVGASPYTRRAHLEHDSDDGGLGGALVAPELAERGFGHRDAAQKAASNAMSV